MRGGLTDGSCGSACDARRSRPGQAGGSDTPSAQGSFALLLSHTVELLTNMIRSLPRTLTPARVSPACRAQLGSSPRPTSVLTRQARHQSTGYHPNLERKPKKGIKVGYLFSGFALLGKPPSTLSPRPSHGSSLRSDLTGLGATSYGLWQVSLAITTSSAQHSS